MAEHTPGPWTTESNNVYIMALNAGEKIIAVMGGEEYLTSEDAANARLIAAAPEMLEALEELVEQWSGIKESHWPRNILDARAVIAKAKGEGP